MGQVHQFSWHVLRRVFGGCIVQVCTCFCRGLCVQKSSSAGARASARARAFSGLASGGMKKTLALGV
jgi:hypothetical protein